MVKKVDMLRQNGDSMFGDNDNENAADALWGRADPETVAKMKRGKRERLDNVLIDQVIPDALQPRRAVPHVIRSTYPNARTGGALVQAWVDYAQAVDVAGIIGGEDMADDVQLDPVSESLVGLAQLAASIRRDGLANPITVVKSENGYHLETGERRWLAFHLLSQYDDGDWSTIPARQVDTFDVWRQSAENNTRSDLNAIGKARQYALLLMDMLAANEVELYALHTVRHEKDFYAQVLDHKPPYGSMARIVSAMGYSSRDPIYKHRDLLKLSPYIWELADDINAPEGVLRGIIGMDDEAAESRLHLWWEGKSQDKQIAPPSPIEEPAPDGDLAAVFGDDITDDKGLYQRDNDKSAQQTSFWDTIQKGARKVFSRLGSLDTSAIEYARTDAAARSRYLAEIADARRLLDEAERRLKE